MEAIFGFIQDLIDLTYGGVQGFFDAVVALFTSLTEGVEGSSK